MAAPSHPWCGVESLEPRRLLSSGAGIFSAPAGRVFAFVGPVEVAAQSTLLSSESVLTVHGGTGSGSYAPGSVVAISADPAPPGYSFFAWIGDTGGIVDVHNPNTSYVVGPDDAVITAQFSPVAEEVARLRESPAEGYITVAVDDAQLTGNSDAPDGTHWNLLLRQGTGANNKMVLLGIADLFNHIAPEKNGSPVQILDAKLHLHRYNTGTSSNNVLVNRVTTDWLTGPAGTNESNVTFQHRDKQAGLTWAAGSFGAADYDAAVTASAPFADNSNGEVVIDVGELVSNIFTSGENNGFVLRTDATSVNLSMRSSEISGEQLRPWLEVSYSYGQPTEMHWLEVKNGSGSGFYYTGQPVNIVANPPADGEAFNMWVGDVGTHNNHTMLDWANQLNPSDVYYMPAYPATITATYRDADRPLDWTARWEHIVANDFGAEKEPLVYEAFGDMPTFEEDGFYRYVSETSAYMAVETTLPTSGYIEYGTTAAYGSRVDWAERPTYLHGFYLTDLAKNTTYHYRFVMTDERGNTIVSDDATFTTSVPANVKYISGGHFTQPYVISSSGYYLLQGDVTADYTAFEINANNVTLDLGGHTVVYNNVDYQVPGDNWPDYVSLSSFGVKVMQRTAVGIHNGRVLQGDGSNSASSASIGYSPLYVRSSTGEITGITAEQTGDQVPGIFNHWGSSLVRFNIVKDHGSDIHNRHTAVAGITATGHTNHNLILRSRDGGIIVSNDNTEHYDNEIYIDSAATNSFGIGLYNKSGNTVYENRIFGGGYLLVAIGVVSHSSNIVVRDNFIHMQANEPDYRWPEYGAQAGVNGFRQTWGGVNLTFENNYIIAYAQDGGYARGLWAYQDANTSNIHYINNVFKTHLINTASTMDDGSIIITGSGDTSGAEYVTFTGNRIISNFININHGTSLYGVGSNARYIGNTIVRTGDRPDYRAINLARGIATGHQFLDTTFEGGASFDDYYMGGGSQDFTVSWTLTVQTEPGASVVIRDVTGAVVFDGHADGAGVVAVPLLQFKLQSSGRILYTDHTLTLSKPGYLPREEVVTMDRTRTLVAPLTSENAPVLDAQVVGRYIFYNNSFFDGRSAAANPADDAAIAIDKQALLPGQTATFANYTSYTRGINGIMIDIAGLPDESELSAADFAFHVGNSDTPEDWIAAAAPTLITIRRGAGTDQSDRITLIWADNAIQKQWLEVTVLAGPHTGLAAPDRFYFGNAIGDSGNSPLHAVVDSLDEVGARHNPRTPSNLALITDVFDYNRDGLVDSIDQVTPRHHATTPSTMLRLIKPPAIDPVGAAMLFSRVDIDAVRDDPELAYL